MRIATAMSVSEKRIRNILSAIYGKLGVHEEKGGNPKVASINKAREMGLLNDL